MHSQLNYLIVQQRHIELACRAEHARLAAETHPARSASSPRSELGWLLASRRPRAARPAQAGAQASPGPTQECLTCAT